MATGAYVNGGGTTTNSGLIQMPTAYDYTNTGTFTNNGIVRANTVSGITNHNVIIGNTCPIFTVAGSANYTINGIFTDATAINQAGTYTAVGNLFVADNTLPSGSPTLYAKLSGVDCESPFVVPFDFNNVKPTAVSISSTTVCEGASVSLLATCASGTPIWYANATGGTSLGTGTSFSYSPPVVGENQIFYAACETTNCKSGRVSTSNTVTVNANPTALASSNSPVCVGSTINLFSGNSRKVAITSGAE